MRRDIENDEIKQILKLLKQNDINELSSKVVLDIGCGDGRLSYEFAKYMKIVYGIDPLDEEIETAISLIKKDNLIFKVADAVDLPFDDEIFDLVIFTLSLCCMDDVEAMNQALKEAWRVINKNGYLLNLQPSMMIDFNSGMQWYLITGNMDDLTLWHSQDSRFALKIAAHQEQKYSFVDETVFTTQWLHEDKQAALESWTERYQNEYHKLDDTTKEEISAWIDGFVSYKGVIFPVNETLTLLKKTAL